MLVGQQLGPFVIDGEVGSGAMGTVYRGRYTKTGQVVAIKIMAPGLGLTRSGAAERFEREGEILKQLRHPNIVRLFGVGKERKMRYYAMEYVEGESLDKVMARRGRISWEEVVELGRQLCAALQHAHEQGIVHRDLKPSNLMILRDGTLKLTDFGIAKDLDETALTSTNCTVGTASYMSPEQCRGERHITHKSDLYSLGVVLYELLTGQKPFQAESAMDMFVQHVQGTFARPSRLVLDLPVWLDNLICQLLEKKPEDRPLDAATVALALESVREKVEAQQSAGVEAVRARIMDRPRGRRNASDEDREAARTLMTGKGKPRKRKKKPLHERVWFRAAGLLLLLAGVVALLVLALRPPSADALYRRAERLMTSDKPESREKARDGPIKEYLARYGDVPGEKTEQVRKWAEEVDVGRLEKLLERHLSSTRKEGLGLKVEAKSEGQERALKAAVAEDEGDRDRAIKLWREARALLEREENEREWKTAGVALAARHLQTLQAIPLKEKELRNVYDREVRDRGKEPELGEPEQAAFTALRYEWFGKGLYEDFGDRRAARKAYLALKAQTAKGPGQRFWYLFAACKAKEVSDKLDKNPQAEKDRKALVRGTVEAAAMHLKADTRRLIDIRAVCLDVVALYGTEEEMAGQVKEARGLLKQLAEKIKEK